MSKILAVDDEAEDLNTIKTVLEEKGYEVVLATNGAQALDSLEDHDLDVILIDIQMPTLSGYDLLRLLKERLNGKTKMIYVSIVPEKEVDMSDIDGFVQKPFTPEILIKDSKKRIKLYQELAKIHNLEDLEAEKNQISNKYKNFPTEFKNLFKILQLKILAKNANIKSIDTKKIIKYGDEIYRLTLEFKKIPPFKKMKVLIKNKVDFSITDNLLKIDSNDLDKNKLFRLLKNSLITLK